ncbi:hypothetical protein BDN67DRAFT_1015300 [Paxillus ammoniavirescens]|nr:hypothetical protein BDN67DRAFT_1015300 [Paxillus ammoniavirescens]
MPPTCTLTNTHTITIPSSERSCNPPSHGLMAKYVAFTEESRNSRDITRCCQTSSPLLDTYLALLQNYRITNVVKFIERTNHLLNEHDWIITTLEHVHDEQQELLINVLHQLNFEDLVHDINRAHYSPHQGPLDHRNRVPPSSSPSSESEVSSSPISKREISHNITPNRTHSSSTVSPPICRPSTLHNVLTTISESPLPIPAPCHCSSQRNRTQVIFSCPLTHLGSSSSSIPRQGSGDSPEDSIDIDLTPEQTFELSAKQVIAAANDVERQDTASHFPLPPSHPQYHSACYQCHCLGYICINCEWYECPTCHRFSPGRTQYNCPVRRAPSPTLVGDYDKFDTIVNANITGSPAPEYREF